MGNLDAEFWLRLLACQMIVEWVCRRYAEALELRGIEQATIDAEFWEIAATIGE